MNQTAQIYRAFLASKGLNTDTRTLTEGQIYFALKGSNFDGNAFVDEALRKGASTVVTSEQEHLHRPHCLVVNDPLRSLQELANFHRKQMGWPIVAVTGSNGKTTTKELVRSVLSSNMKVQCTEGNLNNHIGVPMTLLQWTEDCEVGILEMGANHIGEIHNLCTIAEPDCGLITNIGWAHLEGFGGIDGVKEGKGELYQYLQTQGGAIFCNKDELYLEDMVGQYKGVIIFDDDGLVIFGRRYGFKSLQGPYCQLMVSHEGDTFVIRTRLIGHYNYRNILVAIVVGLYFDIPIQKIADSLQGFGLNMNRSEVRKIGAVEYILDAYNANPSSMEVAIDNLDGMDFKRKGAILGEMKELGEQSSSCHLHVLKKMNQLASLQMAIFIGAGYGEFQEKFPQFYFFNDISSAMGMKPYLEEAVDVCLVKGSRSNRLEKWFE